MNDKLKARIEEQIGAIRKTLRHAIFEIFPNNNRSLTFQLSAWQALLFVVERHRSSEFGVQTICDVCYNTDKSEWVAYPCTEIKGIAERLGIEL